MKQMCSLRWELFIIQIDQQMKYGGQSGSSSTTRHRAYSYYEGSQSSNKYNPKFAEESRLRIIQNNLICVSGLSESLSNKQVLRSKKYFGKYGDINKVIISANGRGYGSKLNSQAYITYESKLDAAIAMMAVDQILLAGRQISVTYGTTKYCTHFLKGIECRNSQCYFMHEYDPNNELDDSHKGSLIKQSIQTALITINNYLEYYVKKEFQENNKLQEEIPSIGKTLQMLVENGDVYAEEYEAVREQELKKRNTKINKPHRSPSKQASSKNTNSPMGQNEKTSKSISISTKGSPTKQSGCADEGLLQNASCNASGADYKGDMVDRIENLIIKSIMGKRCIYKSRFAFASSQSTSSEDCAKICNYVKKHLLQEIV